MKKIEQLTTADFPGKELDEEAFEAWRTSKVQAEKNVKIFGLITISILVIALLTTQHFIAPGAILVILVMFGIRSKSNKMAKAMGLNERMILAARKGRFKA